MPVYSDRAPGVYVEEVRGVPPIAGVSTSIAAFLGQVADDVEMPRDPKDQLLPLTPVNEPKPITNFDQFQNKFGKFSGELAEDDDDKLLTGNKLLAHAVYGFFLNGGTKCYVARAPDINGDVSEALAELEKIDEISLVAAPGARTQAVQDAIIDHCQRTMQDRFAILDGQDTTDIDAAAIKGATKFSDYAGLYFPDLKVSDRTPDPTTGRPVAGRQISLPPSGHVAGIFARVDQTRGVHKAPANESVAGALGLDYLVTKNEQGSLNVAGINVIRGFDGNIKVWGARTLGGDANGEFKYVNVRRLFLFLRESIDEGTQFAVFEPNADPLWAKIRRTVTAFLTNVWRDGALFGNSPEEAFYVRCDETTNPPEVRELGLCITEIGVAVVKPAEFVIFRISQITGAGSE
jgi:hypothetical protein